MFRKFLPRTVLIGFLAFLWWSRQQKEAREKTTTAKPIDIEMPPGETVGFDDISPTADLNGDALVDASSLVRAEAAPETTELVMVKAEIDDLQRIEGIGPKIASVLNESNIVSYAQLAAMSIGGIRSILDDGGIRTARPDTWPEQAKLAAKGDWEALALLQSQLKGGRRV